MRTVWDELRSTISMKLGVLIKEIETAIVNITLGQEAIELTTYGRMITMMQSDLISKSVYTERDSLKIERDSLNKKRDSLKNNNFF